MKLLSSFAVDEFNVDGIITVATGYGLPNTHAVDLWVVADFTSGVCDWGLDTMLIAIKHGSPQREIEIDTGAPQYGFVGTVIHSRAALTVVRHVGPMYPGAVIEIDVYAPISDYENYVGNVHVYDGSPFAALDMAGPASPTPNSVFDQLSDLAAAIADAGGIGALTEPETVPTWPVTAEQALAWILATLLHRTRVSAASGKETLFGADGTTELAERVLTDDGVDFVRGAMNDVV